MYAVALMSQIYTTNRKNELGVPEVRRDIQINGTKKKKQKTIKNSQKKQKKTPVQKGKTKQNIKITGSAKSYKYVEVCPGN